MRDSSPRKTHGAAYSILLQLHDLWVLLAWAGIIAGILLNTFYHRSCFEFNVAMNPLATCQPSSDLALMFLAAVGAGILMRDERTPVLGFLIANTIASAFFIAALITPSLLGLTSTGAFNVILSRAVTLALGYEFPLAIFFSLMGSLLGRFLAGKLPTKR